MDRRTKWINIYDIDNTFSVESFDRKWVFVIILTYTLSMKTH